MMMKRPATGKSSSKPPLKGTTPSGLVLNKKELRKFKEIAYENRDVEFLYLRENEFETFDPYIALPKLKVLDLSINSLLGKVDFLHHMPSLRHLYLTGNRLESLEGISSLPHLETLCMSDNEVTSFDGLDDLPSLRVLSLNFNSIANFRGYPCLPSLYALNLSGNPIAEEGTYRKMAIAATVTSLAQLDGKPVEDEERRSVEHYVGKVVYCVTEGMIVQGDQAEEQAEAYLLNMQRDTWKEKPLSLQAISLASTEEGSNVITEGVPVSLHVCLQDTRPLAEARDDVLVSSQLFPVAFKVFGDAQEVFVLGEMNGWGDPIPLRRCEDGDTVFFQTTLYLPAGDHEYCYMVDGEIKVMNENKAVSKHKKTPCNIYHVVASPPKDDNDDEEPTTVLHIRWMRNNDVNGFELIDDENGLTYTPTSDQIGYCLRAEVLAYIGGEFSFLYFDISSPVSPGAPRCSSLEVDGKPAEGEVLAAKIGYVGGTEGSSVVQWFRITPDEVEQEIILDGDANIEEYCCTLADIGTRIRLEYTPIRSDGEAGEKKSVTVGPVTAGVPTCRSMAIKGQPLEDHPITVETQYSGGFEGSSQFQWFRFDDASNDWYPIPGETTATYTPSLQDVKKRLAVEYTPVSQEGISGAIARCVTDKLVEPGPPEILNLCIKGACDETQALIIDYDYRGGRYGIHQIDWYALDDAPSASARNKKVKIGRSNLNSCPLGLNEVGKRIAVEVVPVREDGKKGKMVHAKTTDVVRPALPSLRSLQIVSSAGTAGPTKVGAVLEAKADYLGGTEGQSQVQWCRESAETREFAVIAQGTKKYVVQSEDAGRLVQLVYTPIRKDGVQGESKTRLIEIKEEEQKKEEAAPAKKEEEPPKEEPKAEAEPKKEEEQPASNNNDASASPDNTEAKKDDQPSSSTDNNDAPKEEPAKTEETAPASSSADNNNDADNADKKEDAPSSSPQQEEEKKPETPRNEEPKKEDSKPQTPRNEEPQKEDSKPQTPRNEEPKKEDSKPQTPRNEEPKKEDSKPQTPRNEEPKKEDSKPQTPRNEEPKAEGSKPQTPREEKPKTPREEEPAPKNNDDEKPAADDQ